MSILIKRTSFEDRAKFFRKNRPTICRLLGKKAEPVKKFQEEKKAEVQAIIKPTEEAKTKEQERPIFEEKNLSIEEFVVDSLTENTPQDIPSSYSYTLESDVEELVIDGISIVDAPDDLTKIKGIGVKMVENLNLAGITNFEQIANLTEEQITDLGKSIRGFAASCKSKNFKKQAQELNQ